MDGRQGDAVAADSGGGAARPVHASSSAGEASVHTSTGVDGANAVPPAAAAAVAQSDSSSPSRRDATYEDEDGGTGSSSSENASASQADTKMPSGFNNRIANWFKRW